MKKPVVLSIDCIDHDPIEKWIPEDPMNVSIWVNLRIGMTHSAGDYFQLKIVTPKRFLKMDKDYSLVVEEYSWECVLNGIDDLLENSRGDSWEVVAAKLSKHMRWEFDNYSDKY